ncbi:DUF1801 domain-containing protein [bacterium]|nr:MAG: DUF1801 domain-containing protein [bacterium]
MAKAVENVETFLASLQHPMKAEIERVRGIVLAADGRLTERVKWKAPSFCSEGDDRITFNLRPQDRVQLIFHRGAKVKDASDFAFEDPSGLFKWAAKDRATVELRGIGEIEAHEAALSDLVRRWIAATVEN